MDAATAAAIAGIIGTLAAVIRWLLQVWLKQSEELEKVREAVMQKTIRELESAVENHKKVLSSTASEIKDLRDQMIKVAAVGVKVQEKWTDLSSRLESYVDSNQQNIDKLHLEILNIGKDLILLKGSHAKKSNQ